MFISEETEALVGAIAQALRARDESVAVSENCCGGLIASYLVSVSGASQFFVGGTTTYALKSRLVLSGWSEEDVRSYTGPSEEVALRLARNLKFELGATYTLAETGWTGPHGDAQCGEAFVACCGPRGSRTATIASDTAVRVENMELFARRALEFLLETIKQQ